MTGTIPRTSRNNACFSHLWILAILLVMCSTGIFNYQTTATRHKQAFRINCAYFARCGICPPTQSTYWLYGSHWILTISPDNKLSKKRLQSCLLDIVCQLCGLCKYAIFVLFWKSTRTSTDLVLSTPNIYIWMYWSSPVSISDRPLSMILGHYFPSTVYFIVLFPVILKSPSSIFPNPPIRADQHTTARIPWISKGC